MARDQVGGGKGPEATTAGVGAITKEEAAEEPTRDPQETQPYQ